MWGTGLTKSVGCVDLLVWLTRRVLVAEQTRGLSCPGRRNYCPWPLSLLLAVGRVVSHFVPSSSGDRLPFLTSFMLADTLTKAQPCCLIFAAHFRQTFGKGTWMLLLISYSTAVSSALLILLLWGQILLLWGHFTTPYYSQPRHHAQQTCFY